MKINSELIDKIKSYSKENSSKEVCGFIVESNDCIKFLPIENKHPDSQSFFLISPKDYLNIKNNYNILYFFHSHINNPNFSKLDIFHQKYHNMDMLLYNIQTDEMKEMKCKQ
jgi:hypothetical protein